MLHSSPKVGFQLMSQLDSHQAEEILSSQGKVGICDLF